MNAHLLKFKNEKGEWVSIPCLVSDIYNMYVTYCKEKGITPVSQDDYYISVGMLGTLVSQLAGSTEAVQSLSKALNSGTLPTFLGGTGLIISPNEYVYTLLTEQPEDWGTNYAQYYKKEYDGYVALTTPESWIDDTFYKRTQVDYIGSSLEEYLTDENGLNLITVADAQEKADAAKQGAVDHCIAKSSIAVGDSDPNSGVPASIQYYFQIQQ